MQARRQRRVQRYGWDLAAPARARYWHGALAGVSSAGAVYRVPAEFVIVVAQRPMR